MSSARIPLGPSNLVTVTMVRAELGCRAELARRIVGDLRPRGPARDRCIWPVATSSWGALREAIARACEALGQPAWTPKGLRKLRTTLSLEDDMPRLIYEAEYGHTLERGLEDYAQRRAQTQAEWAARRADEGLDGAAVVPIRRKNGDS